MSPSIFQNKTGKNLERLINMREAHTPFPDLPPSLEAGLGVPFKEVQDFFVP
jgi:hypothetical protein